MAEHGFGIMENPPEKGKRFDDYEPDKYSCIFTDDIYIEDIITGFSHIDCCYHSTDIKGKGLNYCGITLIPPSSLPAFSEVIRDKNGLADLYALTETAIKEDKWIIHFGL